MSEELKRPSTNMICYKCKKEIFHDEDKTFISEYPFLYPVHVACMIKITGRKRITRRIGYFNKKHGTWKF